MIKHLASLAEDRLIISFAPKTLAYSVLKRIGELFPGPSKVWLQLQTSSIESKGAVQVLFTAGNIISYKACAVVVGVATSLHAVHGSVFTNWPSMDWNVYFWQHDISSVQSDGMLMHTACHCMRCVGRACNSALPSYERVFFGCCRQLGRIFMLRQMWRLPSNKRASK